MNTKIKLENHNTSSPHKPFIQNYAEMLLDSQLIENRIQSLLNGWMSKAA